MSNYHISKSSLLSLKAEILRKQEEVKNKIRTNEKKKVPLVIKNKGVDARNERDTVEDLDLLEKSRIALEKKAKLYEKLSKSKVIDDDPASFPNRFLVRFKDKDKDDEQSVNANENSEEEDLPQEYEEPDNSDEQWVEYVDCLGRTRTCLKKDLHYFQARDQDYKRDEPNEKSNLDNEEAEEKIVDDVPEKPQMLSDDMRREILRQQWEREENELRNKDDIHYQDILFSEARTHGVGYYSFSKDEEQRRTQQESLEKLRLETQREQKKCQDLKAMREQQLAARIKAAKLRKRARLGLPLEEDEEEEPEIGPPVPQPTHEEPEKNEEDALKERLLEEARRNHVRPWDIGKEKVNEFYEYSQEEWVEKKRKERIDEFAPPTAFRRDFRALPSELEIPKSEGSLRFTSKKLAVHKTDQQHVNPYKHTNEDIQDPFNEETRTFKPYIPTLKKRSNKRNYDVMANQDECNQNEVCTDAIPDVNTSIQDACSEVNITSTSSTSIVDDAFDNNVPVEVVPKFMAQKDHTEGVRQSTKSECAFDYSSEKIIPQNIEASIEAGLKFLRTQAEKRGSIRDYENGDMFAS